MSLQNFGTKFIVDFFTDALDAQIPLVDILFGNETEADALNKKKGWGCADVGAIAKKAQELPKKGKSPRIVVFTQGAEKTVVATDAGGGVRGRQSGRYRRHQRRRPRGLPAGGR